MDEVFDKNGKKIVDIEKGGYPIYYKVETTEGLKFYKTIKTNAGKICTSSIEQDSINLKHLGE